MHPGCNGIPKGYAYGKNGFFSITDSYVHALCTYVVHVRIHKRKGFGIPLHPGMHIMHTIIMGT